MSNDVFVWIEQTDGVADPISWETLGAARRVAGAFGGKVVTVILGEDVGDLAQKAVQYGADSAFIADDATLKHFRLEPYAAVLTKLVQEQQPAAILMGAVR